MRTSIRRRLLYTLVAALLVGSLITAMASYFFAGDEVKELYDHNLKQVAETLAKVPTAQYQGSTAGAQKDRLRGEEEFLIQIWLPDGTLVYSSHKSIAFPLQQAKDFGQSEFNGEMWRYYLSERKGQLIQTAQPVAMRDEATMEVIEKLLVPQLLMIPILCWLFWAAINRALVPLDTVSRAIELRRPSSMRPLDLAAIPTEIRPLVQGLNDLLERLDTALTTQRNFTADAAHQLRTPLTAIQLQLEVLERSNTEGDRADALRQLSGGIKRSIHLVRQLLSLSRIEAQAGSSAHEEIDLCAMTNEVIALFSEQAFSTKIELNFVEHFGIEFIEGEPESIRTLIESVLDNAIRYTPAGGKVQLELYSQNGTTCLAVRDSGIGIDPSNYNRVFDRFYRVNESNALGSGLGLTIVKRIADAHHASIHLDSGIDGKGLTVEVKFHSKTIP